MKVSLVFMTIEALKVKNLDCQQFSNFTEWKNHAAENNNKILLLTLNEDYPFYNNLQYCYSQNRLLNNNQ